MLAAAGAVERFCKGIVDAVAPYVVAVKPQVAFFEALGSDGWRALEAVSLYAREAGLLVIADAKRGDIGSTARAYATAFLEPTNGGPPLADALTVSPYLGRDSLDPFFAACRREGAGLFLLVRTSNAGAAELQDAALSDGRPLWRHVAELVDGVGRGARRRARALERRRGRRRDRAAHRRRGAEGDAACDHPPARRRGAGRGPGGRRARLHERAVERARQRLAVDHLRLSGLADRRLAGGRGRRGCAALRLGLVCGRLVKLDRAHVARVAAPVLFLLAVTVAVLLVRSGLRENDPPAREPAGRRAAGRPANGRRPCGRHASEAIAERTGTTVEVLARLNPGLDPELLRVGQRVRVRDAG